MASPKQLRANRANAKRSTGPKSADGKARSSKNSLAHGLTARDIVIGDEDPEEFERLRTGLQADFKPASVIEQELVERLAGLLWRLRRIPVLEGALLDARQEETASGAEDFTLPVTVKQRSMLMALWHELQDPEYQEFLNRFYAAYASRGAADTFEEVDETTSILNNTNAAHDLVGDASAEPAEKSERYHSKHLRLRIDDPDGKSRRSIRTGRALIKDAEKHDVLGKLSRYEASLANAVARTLSLLHSIQASGLITNDDGERRRR